MKTNACNMKPKLLVLALASAFSQTVLAASDYWACGSGNWTDACWSSTPVAGDDVYLTESDAINRTVTYNGNYTTPGLNSLTIDTTGTGTMTLQQSANSLVATREYIGNLGAGAYTQSGGTNTVNKGLYLDQSGGTGSYALSGTGNLTAGYEDIGYAGTGTGTFIQSGGTNMVTGVGGYGLIVGDVGNGYYTLSAGSLSAANEFIGNSSGGTGTFIQSGGTNTVTGVGELILGNNYGSTGSYTLSGGSMSAVIETIGDESTGSSLGSTGTFTQSGGTNAVGAGGLILGNNPNSTGSYTLSSGGLSAPIEYIGYGSNGTFTQSGGTNTVTSLFIGYYSGGTGSYYTLSGGNLAAVQETIGDYGYSGTDTFTQSGGTNSVGAGGLLFGSNGGTGTYTLSGGNLTVGTLSTGGSISTGTGTSSLIIDGGTLSVGGGNGSINVTNFTVGDAAGSGSYTLSGGSLTAVNEALGMGGSTGSITQSGGTNTVSSNLILGSSLFIPGNSHLGPHFLIGTGNYTLSGGSLNVGGNIVNGGNSSLTIDGGTLSVGGGNGSINVTNFTVGDAAGSGSYTLSGGSLTAVNEIIGNNGTGTFTQSGGTNTVGALSIDNGTYTLSGGTLTVNTSLNNGDTFALSGGTLNGSGALANNGLMSGYGTIAGSGGFTNNGLLTQSGGNLTLSNTGANINYGNMDLAGGLQLKLNGSTLDNSGTINLNGALISGSGTLINDIGGNIAGRGSITANSFSNAGNMAVSGGTLNISNSFANSGTIELGGVGTTLAGGLIANSGTIQGTGNVGNAIANTGTIEAMGGALNLTGVVNNNASGIIRASAGTKVLAVNGIASNAGLISLAGGTVDTNGKTFASAGQITGYGVLATGGLSNNGSMTLSGGTTTVNGDVTNAAGANLKIAYNPVIFTGNFINNGTTKITGTTVTYAGNFAQNGAYTSDPATQSFTNLTVGANGYFVGGAGDVWKVSGNFINNSTQNTLWNTAASTLVLNGTGLQNIYLAGANKGASMSGYSNNFSWGDLSLAAGSSLDVTNTNGAALYVGLLQLGGGIGQISSITSPDNIYYNANLAGNAYLGDKNYPLIGGGQLMAAVPEPETYTMLLAGFGFIGFIVYRRKNDSSEMPMAA